MFADGAQVARASELFAAEVVLTVSELDHPYVSRGGLKLAGALDDLALDLQGLVVADIGASTGGFTDCALSRGAARVYAIDVGHGQLHPRLASDPRVIAREGVNARHLDAGQLARARRRGAGRRIVHRPRQAAARARHASSLARERVLDEHGRLLALVKPQFEVGPEHVGARGVVSDDELRAQALEGVRAAAAALRAAPRVARSTRASPGPRATARSLRCSCAQAELARAQPARSAASASRNSAAFSSVSSVSRCGSLSATMPPPAA